MKPNGSPRSAVHSMPERLLGTLLPTVKGRLLSLFVFCVSTVASAQPPTPSGLAVLGTPDGQVNLAWTPDATAAAYGISRQLWDLTNTPTPNTTGTPTPMATVASSAIPPAPTPAYEDFQVTNGRPYLYQVWGIDSGGNPGLAATVTAKPFFAPFPVQPVTVSNIHDNALDVSWGIPASSYPVAYYEILRYAYLTTTFTPTPNASFTATNTPSPTNSFTLTATVTPDPTDSPTPTVTADPTDTPTGTLTLIPTDSPTNSLSPTITLTGTSSFTFSPTLTSTVPFTSTPTYPPPPPAPTLFATATPVATVFGTSFSDTSINPTGALAYFYEVLAVDDIGNSSSPPPASSNGGLPSVNTVPGPPSLSGNLSSNSYGVSLFWSGNLPAEGVTAFQVLQNGATLATINATTTPTYSYFDSTIPSGEPVSYAVQAQNAFGGTSSKVLFESVLASSESAVAVTPVVSPAGVSISWPSALPGTYGLASYAVYKSLGGAPSPNPTPILPGSPTATITPTPFATFLVAPSATPSITAVVDNGLANHTAYWVQPFDSVGHGGILAAAPALNLAPTPASTLVALGPSGNNQVNVSWNGGGPGFFGTTSDWVLYRFVTPFLTPTPVPSGTVTPVPTSTPGLTPPTASPTPKPIATIPFAQTGYLDIVPNYPVSSLVSYQIGLADSMGNLSDLVSSGTTVTLGGLTVPATPQMLPFAGTASSVRLSWLSDPSADAVTGYAVFGPDLPTLTTTPTPVAEIAASGSTLVFAPTPTPWAAIYYYVSAQNSVGMSAPATISGIAVPTYQVTAVLTPGSRQAQVSWNMTPVAASAVTVDSFGVYRSQDPINNFSLAATVGVGTNSYTDPLPAVTAGVTYYYLVTARAGFSNNQPAESPQKPPIKPFPEGSLPVWPNPPAGVTAVSALNKTSLSWAGNNPHENVSSYSVFYVNSGGTPTPTGTWNTPTPVLTPVATPTPIATVLATNNPTITYVFAATETPGNLSSYYVVANNAQGPSDSAVTLSVMIPPAVTPTVTLAPPAYVVPSATLTPGVWISGLTYPNAVGGYTIYRQSAPTPGTTPTFFPVATVAAPTPFVEDPGMPGYVNNYLVAANNGSVTANPAVSAPLSVTLWPSAPNVALLPSASAVTVSWGLPAGNVPVSFYDIYRSAYPTTTPVFIATTTPTAVSYVDSAVTTGSAYLYWMDAQNASGPSSLSSPQTIIPIQPVLLTVTPLPERNQLSWPALSVPANSPVTGYAVFRAPLVPSVTPTFVQVGSILEPLSNTGTVDASGVTDGNSYLYEVAPASSTGILGPFSSQVAVTVFPQAVSNLEAVSGDGLVQLRWIYQGVASNSYIITRRLGSAPASSAQTLAGAFQGSDFTDSSVTDKTFYVYNIYSVDAVGLTSTASTALALPAAPPALPIVAVQTSSGPVTTVPASVTLTQNTSNAQTLVGNTLSWGGADQPASFVATTMYPLGGYDVLRSSEGGGVYQSVAQLPATYVNGYPAPSASYFDQVPLVNGTTYTYLIQAYDAPPDLPVPLSQAATQGLVHSSSYQPITAYPISPNTALDRNAIRPNGASNERVVNIRFVVTTPGNVEIKAYTLSGTFVREIWNQYYAQTGIYWTSWDAKNMNGSLVASGVYLITTESPGGHQEFDKVAVIK